MNLVALIGNVASEPELTQTSSGTSVCTFRLAVSRPGADSTDFFSIISTGQQADVCGEYLQAGRRVSIEGRLHATGGRVEVVANRVNLGRPT